MPLKKISFNDMRKKMIESANDIMNSFSTIYGNFSSIKNFVNSNYKVGHFFSNNIQDAIEQEYGKSENPEDDIDWKIAVILFNYSVLMKININKYNGFNVYISTASKNEKKLKLILHNVKENIEKFFPEYKISWESNKDFISFESTSTKTITDNLSDIENEVADPIKELLQNMKSDTELRGHISEVYSNIEKINISDYKDKLNGNDYGILKDSHKLAKRIVNDSIDAAKGHIGKSSLTTRDIAHNFALLSSLIYKIINKASNT